MGTKRELRRLSILIQNLRVFCGSPLLALPNEILILIAEFTTIKSIQSLLLVNRHLYNLLLATHDRLAFVQMGIMDWHLIPTIPGLHWAAANGHHRLVRLLLDRGIDINLPENPYGTTALHYAALHGHVAIMKLLLENGAMIHARDRPGRYSLNTLTVRSYIILHGMTPLHYAAIGGNVAAITLLLDKGAKIDERDQSTLRTPLIVATQFRKEFAINLLLKRGANILAGDKYQWTALKYALAEGCFDFWYNHCAAYTLILAHEKRVRKEEKERKVAGIERCRNELEAWPRFSNSTSTPNDTRPQRARLPPTDLPSHHPKVTRD